MGAETKKTPTRSYCRPNFHHRKIYFRVILFSQNVFLLSSMVILRNSRRGAMKSGLLVYSECDNLRLSFKTFFLWRANENLWTFLVWQKTASSRFAKNYFPSPFTTPPATSPLPSRFRPLLSPVSVSFHPSRPLPQMEDFLSNLFPWELMMGETM